MGESIMVDKNKIINQIKKILQSGTSGTVMCDSCYRVSSYSISSEMQARLEAFLLAIEQGEYDYAFERGNQDAEFKKEKDWEVFG